MTLDTETKALLTEAIDEAFEAFVDDQAIKFWEGGIVRTAPTGAPPQYIQVEIEGFYDQNVMWRGVPASLQVGDQVLVWENPRTHRREVLGGSGLTKPSTSSPWQKVTVAVSGGDFTLPSAAIAWIDALPAGVGPSATRLFAVNILGGTFVETADVTISQYIHVGAEGEGTVWDMGTFELEIAADASLMHGIVTGTGSDTGRVIDVIGDNAVMRDVRVIVTAANGCVDVSSCDNVELYGVTCETTVDNGWGFYIYNSTALLWNCKADDTVNSQAGLILGTAGSPSTVTSLFCQFRAKAAGNDVNVFANNTWYDRGSQFDPNNCAIAGTEVMLPYRLAFVQNAAPNNPFIGMIWVDTT